MMYIYYRLYVYYVGDWFSISFSLYRYLSIIDIGYERKRIQRIHKPLKPNPVSFPCLYTMHIYIFVFPLPFNQFSFSMR